jgi:hypothetical protein
VDGVGCGLFYDTILTREETEWRPRLKWEYNIKGDLREIYEGVDWDEWLVLLNTAMYVHFALKLS